MEPLPTLYKGIQFRSRLEARWAFWFDRMTIPYQYEPQSFQVEPDLFYVPDFWLPSQEMYVEIKPDAPSSAEERKAIGLHRVTGQKVFIFAGFPKLMPFSNSTGVGYSLEICNFGVYAVIADGGTWCGPYSVGTLSETMLYIFGLLTRSSNDDELRANTAKLADAVEQSNSYFANLLSFASLRDLIQGFLHSNAND